MQYLFFRLLPKNLVSRLIGKLTDLELPSPLLISLIRVYSRFYGIKLNEIKRSLDSFKTFNQFFTRQLKPELRPVDSDSESIVSPVDGTVAEFGEIKQGLLVQSKGVLYSMNDLIGKEQAKIFQDGFFITIYLSPADYHRIHTPVSGNVSKFSYFSGNLWPVNQVGVQHVGGLFAINERIVTPIVHKKGQVALIKVGATVVGKISVDYDTLTTNNQYKTQLNMPVIPAQIYQKGDELGKFQLGSTVILLFQKGQITPVDLFRKKHLKFGEKIARWKE